MPATGCAAPRAVRRPGDSATRAADRPRRARARRAATAAASVRRSSSRARGAPDASAAARAARCRGPPAARAASSGAIAAGRPARAARRRPGTTRFAASVGVEARRSATSSSSGWSFSWPIALTTGVDAAATARSSRSSLKPEQVLRVAAAAGDDDHVDVRVGIQRLERPDRLGDAAVALHGGVGRAEPHLRPAQLGVVADVLLGIGLLAGDQADDVGEERERLLAGGRRTDPRRAASRAGARASRAGRRVRRAASTTRRS